MDRLDLFTIKHKLRTIDKAEWQDFLEKLIHNEISSFHNHFPQFDLKELPLILKLESGIGGGSRSKILRSESDLERIITVYKGKISEDQLRSLLKTPNKESIVKVFASNMKDILELYYDQFGFWYNEYNALNEEAPNGSICSLIFASDLDYVFKVSQHKSADKHGYQIVFNNYPFDVWLDGKYLYQSLPYKRKKLLDKKCSNDVVALVDQLLEMDYKELEEDLSRCKTSEEHRRKLDYYLKQLIDTLNSTQFLKKELFGPKSIELDIFELKETFKEYDVYEDSQGHVYFPPDRAEYEAELNTDAMILAKIITFIRKVKALYERSNKNGPLASYFSTLRVITRFEARKIGIQKMCLYFVILTNTALEKTTRNESRNQFLEFYYRNNPPYDKSQQVHLDFIYDTLLDRVKNHEMASIREESIKKYWNKDYFGVGFKKNGEPVDEKVLVKAIKLLRTINEDIHEKAKLMPLESLGEVLKHLKKVENEIARLENADFSTLFTDT